MSWLTLSKHAHGLAKPDSRELLQVQVYDNLIPVGHVFPGLSQCIVRAASGSEAEARPRERRVEERFQGLRDRLLYQTVHHSGDAQLAHPTARLGDLHPAHRLWLVAAVQQAGEQRVAVGGNPRTQLGDLHPVHPRRAAIRLHPLECPVQVRRADHLFHQLPRQGSFMIPCRGRLLLLERIRSSSAIADCAGAQRSLQGFIEKVPLVRATPGSGPGACLLPLHAHRLVQAAPPGLRRGHACC